MKKGIFILILTILTILSAIIIISGTAIFKSAILEYGIENFSNKIMIGSYTFLFIIISVRLISAIIYNVKKNKSSNESSEDKE